jgi:hypothetical protein
MNESSYTRKINKLLRSDVYAWKVSDRFTAGIPDCYYSGPRADLWVEYKLIKDLQRTKQCAALSALQSVWLLNRMHEGRDVAVIVGVGTKKGLILTGSDIWLPLRLEETVSCQEIADWISNFTCDPEVPQDHTIIAEIRGLTCAR